MSSNHYAADDRANGLGELSHVRRLRLRAPWPTRATRRHHVEP
jgi:hypothetical protein